MITNHGWLLKQWWLLRNWFLWCSFSVALNSWNIMNKLQSKSLQNLNKSLSPAVLDFLMTHTKFSNCSLGGKTLERCVKVQIIFPHPFALRIFYSSSQLSWWWHQSWYVACLACWAPTPGTAVQFKCQGSSYWPLSQCCLHPRNIMDNNFFCSCIFWNSSFQAGLLVTRLKPGSISR